MKATLLKLTDGCKTINKHSALAAMSSVVTAQQRKAFNGLLYVARTAMLIDGTQTRFQVPLHLLKSLTGIEATNNQQIKESVKGLMRTVVELNTLGHDSEWEWRATTLLAEAMIHKNGILEFGFSPSVLESILTPKSFALLNLDIIKRLHSKYAIALYEAGRDYINTEWPVIALEDFRRFMGFAANKYVNFADLRKRVIDPAVSEINSKTDLQIECDPVRMGKKVIGLKICIVEKPDDTGFPKNINEFNKLYEMLTPCLATDDSVLRLINEKLIEYDFEYVASNIRYAMNTAKKDPLELLKLALDGDYAENDRLRRADNQI